MARTLCIALLVLGAFSYTNALQEQEAVDLSQFSEPSLSNQVKSLQKNVTDLWNYIYELRNAMSQHLVHLRQHQMQIESTLHEMSHHHDDDHHHSSSSTQEESHSHSHSHMDSHSHDHGDSHEHKDSHGDGHRSTDHHHDDYHHHDEHKETGDHSHSHGANSDSHGDHSHSHGDHSHSHGDYDQGHGQEHGHHDHSEEHHHHGDSREKHDSKEHDQQKQEEVVEKVMVATQVSHHHHHHGGKDPLDLLSLHHSGHSHRQSRNMTDLPKMSDSESYNYALCNVKPNTAIAQDLQQDVTGQVSFWQNKEGGPLGIHVKLSGFKIGGHGHHHQQHTQQQQGLETDADDQEEDNTMPGGHRHGFHIHETGDLSNSCQSTGPHYNPKVTHHGGPTTDRHFGDLGNIECDDHGYTNIVFNDQMLSLSGPYSIAGRSLVIHSSEDDYGMNPEDPESLRTGNSGIRIACCVIERVTRLPSRTYKSMRIAKQHKN